jgi:hypothetical protein
METADPLPALIFSKTNIKKLIQKLPVHYFQIIKSKRFQQFDYGPKNMKIYGTKDPPEYKLKNVLAPVWIYHGTEDAIIGYQVW